MTEVEIERIKGIIAATTPHACIHVTRMTHGHAGEKEELVGIGMNVSLSEPEFSRDEALQLYETLRNSIPGLNGCAFHENLEKYWDWQITFSTTTEDVSVH